LKEEKKVKESLERRKEGKRTQNKRHADGIEREDTSNQRKRADLERTSTDYKRKGGRGNHQDAKRRVRYSKKAS
jgi:hypothetical protein